jgi:hypothetical protein
MSTNTIPINSILSKNWPKIRPIERELPAVDLFQPELLPESFRPVVSDVANRMQCPIDFAAVAALAALAGAVNRRACIQPKENDDEWIVIPNVWGAIIGNPSQKKSPVLKSLLKPLEEVEEEWIEEYRQKVKSSAKTDQRFRRCDFSPPDDSSVDEGAEEKITCARLITNNTTPEALHLLLGENPNGLLMVRDELSGWISEFSQKGRETERAFFLTCWNGDSRYKNDRIGRGMVIAPSCCMSIIGSIQPKLLRKHLAEDGMALQADGLLQRFGLAVWPDARRQKYVDQKADKPARERFNMIIQTLTGLDSEAPRLFRFASDAQELFVDWYKRNLLKIEEEEHQSPAIAGHMGKYDKLMPSLALLFQLAEMAASGVLTGFEGENERALYVSLENTVLAFAWCDYLESHARRIYSCMGSPEQTAAKLLAEKLKDGSTGADGTFTLREVLQKKWKGLQKPEAVKGALALLESAGWVRDISTKPGAKGGRPSLEYAVNPGLE